MSRQPRWEIVHTTTGWHARFRSSNGNVIVSSLRADCNESGTYNHNAIGGDSGPANKHSRETGHPTVCHVADWSDAA